MSLQSVLESIKHPKTSTGTLLRDIAVILLIVAAIGLVLFAFSGTWPALVAVESGSMEPNIPTYALAFVTAADRYGGWQTQEEALASGSDMKFNGYGDVIVYQPNGITGVTPIIHRALSKVTAEEAETNWGFSGDAAHAGTITKGDNNAGPDQSGYFKQYGRMQPVKDEWIVGKAIFAIPLIGWVPLNIIPSILIAAGIVALCELIAWFVNKRKKTANANRRDKRNQGRKTQKR